MKTPKLTRLVEKKHPGLGSGVTGAIELKKKALKEMYSFAKKGGKFVVVPMFCGIPTKQQVKICSFTGYRRGCRYENGWKEKT